MLLLKVLFDRILHLTISNISIKNKNFFYDFGFNDFDEIVGCRNGNGWWGKIKIK